MVYARYYSSIVHVFINKYKSVCTSKYCPFPLGWSVPDAVLGLNALVTHEAIIITWMVSSYKQYVHSL